MKSIPITACPPELRRPPRETALARNRLVLTLADEIVVPYVAADSPLAQSQRDVGQAQSCVAPGIIWLDKELHPRSDLTAQR